VLNQSEPSRNVIVAGNQATREQPRRGADDMQKQVFLDVRRGSAVLPFKTRLKFPARIGVSAEHPASPSQVIDCFSEVQPRTECLLLEAVRRHLSRRSPRASCRLAHHEANRNVGSPLWFSRYVVATPSPSYAVLKASNVFLTTDFRAITERPHTCLQFSVAPPNATR
jgi:hypothetical protein